MSEVRTAPALSEATPPSGGVLLFTVEEAADRCRLSRATMFRLVATGDVASLKIGRSRRVPAAALAAWVARLSEEAGQ